MKKNMKYVVVLLIYVVHLVASAEDINAQMTKVLKGCAERNNIQKSDFETAVKEKKLPQSDNGKKFISCIIREIGFEKIKDILRSARSDEREEERQRRSLHRERILKFLQSKVNLNK